MKKILCFILLISSMGFTQSRLTGIVIGQNGMPIQNAEIFLFSKELVLLNKKQTNKQGYFVLEYKKGIYNVEIRYPQANIFKKDIILNKDIDLGNITMYDSSPNENKEIIKSSQSDKEKSYNVTFNSSYNQQRVFPSFVNSLSVIYNYKKWTINSNITYNDEKNVWENDRTTYYPDLTFSGTKVSEYNYKNLSSYINFQFKPSEKTTINVYTINNKYTNGLTVNDNINIYSTHLLRTHYSEKKSDSDNQRNAINFLFTHEFSNKKTITIEADWAQKKGYYKQDTNGQDYDLNNTPIANKSFITFNDGKFDMDVYSINGTMHIPLHFFDVDLGAKWVFAELDFQTNFLRKYQTEYIRDSSLSPTCTYIENRPSFFTNFKKTWNKWNFQFGGKFENTFIKGFVFDTLDKPISNKYYNFLPTVNAKYDFNKDNNITINYQRNLDRPLFRYINPSIGIYNAYENYTGNPTLLPSIVNNFNLTYSYKSKYNVDFLYSNTKNGIGTLATFTPDNVVAHKVLNYLDLTTLQIATTANFEYFNFIETSIQLEGFYKSNKFLIPAINSNNIWGWYGSINNQIYFNKAKTISNNINFWYQSRTIDGEYLFKKRYVLNLGFKFSLLKEALTINLDATDILQSLNEYAESTVYSINQQFRNYWNPRTFGLSIVYKLGNNKLSYQRRYAQNQSDQNR